MQQRLVFSQNRNWQEENVSEHDASSKFICLLYKVFLYSAVIADAFINHVNSLSVLTYDSLKYIACISDDKNEPREAKY